ncbi:hypothetical protein M427DRAFT_110513, partial [Gonapodya prolifera JEL478]
MAAGAPGKIAGNGPLPFIPLNDLADQEDIAEGGMGIIFKATWIQRNFFGRATAKTPVVVKRLRRDRIEHRDLFIQESQTWWNLPKHPNILAVYGGNMDDKRPYLVSPFAEKGNLRSFLKSFKNGAPMLLKLKL